MQGVFEKIIEKVKENAYMVVQKNNSKELGMTLCGFEQVINEVAAEYNNGWIPCIERLPETNESVLCWAKSTARGGDVCFVGSCHNGFWFLQSSADTHSFPGKYVIVAWQSIEPYKQIGE